MKTTRIPTALCALTLCALSACQTAKPAPDILTLPQPAVDAHVKALLLDPNPGFVLRGRMGAWTELAPTLDLLAQSVPDDQLADLLEELGGGGPVVAFEGLASENRSADIPDLALVKREGTGWLRVSVVASDQTWGLLDLGVGLVSPYEPLEFWTVEALLPSSDPAKLAEQFNVGDELQAEVAGPYVRVWTTQGVSGLGDDPEVLESGSMVQKPRPWRMTPALARFISEDAPGALYVRARDTRLLAASSGITQMMRALRFVSAESRHMLMARGISTAMLAISLTPRSVTEFEDHALLLGGDASASGAFLDVVSTRTAFGREVQAAGASKTASLPTISDEFAPPERTILDASYSFHAAAADDLHEPTAAALYTNEKTLGVRDVKQFTREMSEVGPMGMLAILATSPTFFPGVLSSMIDPRIIGDARPLAARVRVAQSSAGQIPFGFAAVIAFTGDTAIVQKRVDELMKKIPPAVQELFTLAFTSGEEHDVLTVAFNLGEGEVFGAAAPLGAAQGMLRFDATPLGSISPEAQLFGAFGQVRVQALPGVSTSFARISISKQSLPDLPAPAYFFDAVSNPDPCVDAVAMAANHTLVAASNVAPEARAELFGPYLSKVSECSEKIDSPHWAVARSRAETFLAFLDGDYDTMLAAYSKACAGVGDEAACVGQKHLERVGPPAPPMDGPNEDPSPAP